MAPSPIEPVERVRRRLTPPPAGPNECWPWPGGIATCGYGRVRIGRGRSDAYAHRLAYEAFIGPAPEELCVLHTCDNPPCVNPAHLFLGTRTDNNADMMAKGRHARRPPELIERVRALAATGLSQRAVASLVGKSQATVYLILKGPPPP